MLLLALDKTLQWNGRYKGNLFSTINLVEFKNKTSWIIDNVVTEYVSCSLENFLLYNIVASIIFRLSSGKYVTTTHTVIVKLSDKWQI